METNDELAHACLGDPSAVDILYDTGRVCIML